jgi:histidinol dehydrogenase
MRCELVSLNDRDPVEVAAELRRLVPAPEEVSGPVAEIIGRVRADGDKAVNAYTLMLDTGGADPLPLPAAQSEVTAAVSAIEADVREGLEFAITNVRRVAEASLSPEDRIVDFGSHVVAVREVPVQRAAVYVPGGRAPYPSTVVMGVVTAKAAGVRDVVVCSPPGRDGRLDRAVLAAAGLAGASAVYRMGGAHAVAALAYGTESVAAVDVIVGPGNLYVQEAKRQVSGVVGIDGLAGPSDLAVIAGDGADHDLVALDLLAQAEHGEGTLVVALARNREFIVKTQTSLQLAPATGAVAVVVEVENAEAALALVEALAPEHLQLIGPDVESLAPRVARAGCVFVGATSGTAFGDYVAGSNHILPTNGSARFASALSPADFRRRYYEVRVRAPEPLARAAAPVARAEGFEAHARSMEARLAPRSPFGVERTSIRDNG